MAKTKKIHELTDRQRITRSMKDLTKLGYFAKANHECCSSCGWAVISDKDAEKAVFYHSQDAEAIKGGTIHDSGLHIAWSGDGEEIVRVFHKYGFLVEWDGSERTRINLKHNDRLKYSLEGRG